MKIRGSELTSFLRCRQQWEYAWKDNLRTKKPNDKLLFGTLFHKWLEHFYNTDNEQYALEQCEEFFNSADLSGMEQVDIDDLWDLFRNVVDNYLNFWANDSEWAVLGTELSFEVPLGGGDVYTGTIDIVWEHNGHLWFGDHKTTNSVSKYVEMAGMDRQISRYWWALDQIAKGNGHLYDKRGVIVDNDKSPSGFVYNIILRDYPKPPETLKNGSLSKNKSQKTTWKMYLDKLSELKLDIREYTDILDHFANQETPFGNNFLRRHHIYKNPTEIQLAGEEMLLMIEDMRRPSIYKNITSECSWCAYKTLCQAELDGNPIQPLIDEFYTTEEL